ncbi:hypothetical protein RRG08_049071 [Elysia crispata]|uniref:Uncharacterized protein n=1 Tax=Elysia crispata TaxID=231223 RepID=A0AAE1AB10_9GAST|nr:hypothetical protein RRG08_049071 [Elysia crispata]
METSRAETRGWPAIVGFPEPEKIHYELVPAHNGGNKERAETACQMEGNIEGRIKHTGRDVNKRARMRC